jgi:hypothetical protein
LEGKIVRRAKTAHHLAKFSRLQNSHTRKTLSPVVVILLIAGLFVAFVGIDLLVNYAAKEPEVYVGVDIGFGDENDVKRVADAVQGYANLIIIGSLRVTTQKDNLTRVCDYLYQKGLSFIIYVGFGKEGNFPPQGPPAEFFNETVTRWGNKFLGAYMFDEPGGKQIDYASNRPDKPVPKADNNTDAAIHFILSIEPYLSLIRGRAFYSAPCLKLFTSDYALHWFDYLCGYDIVFGEFTGNQSRQLAIAQTRGAAGALGGDWGTMITWKYEQPPYLEDGEQLYDDMVIAYQNGAKYIVVFNSPDQNPPINEFGILLPEHFEAMKKFWNYAKTNPKPTQSPADTAYVIPGDFGFGFRRPDDNIWGLWPSNATAQKIWNDVNNTLLPTYGMRLDVVYENTTDNVPANLRYRNLIFWNGTKVEKP